MKTQRLEGPLDDAGVRASERRLAEAQRIAGVGSWEWDVASGELVWSEQLYRNFDVDPASFHPTLEAYMGLVHPDDRDKAAAIIAGAMENLEPFEFEHRVVLGSGEVRVHHCTGYVSSAGERAVRLSGTNQDITVRRRAEDKLREAFEREHETVARLQELDAAKSKFVSSVSHELRTPLTSIIGYLQLLQSQAASFSEEQTQMLEIVERNSQRLLGLIEDLLSQSRIESGSFRLVLEPTQVSKVIEAAAQSVKLAAEAKSLDLKVWISPDVGAIMADAGQIERLLLNLLTNSIKFTDEGGIRMCARRESGPGGSDVVIVVADTGIGIPADELPRLFSPFFRSSNAEQTAPGTGLGMVIVKAIVEAHHGSVQVTSDAGRGTTVVVRLPGALEDLDGPG